MVITQQFLVKNIAVNKPSAQISKGIYKNLLADKVIQSIKEYHLDRL